MRCPDPVFWRDHDQGVYVLYAEWRCEVEDYLIVIDSGFGWDLASIPRVLFPVVNKDELGIIAPLVHDWLYQHRGLIKFHSPVSRREADRLFRVLMREDGVGPIRRKAAWLAVRLFGWLAWR